MRAFKQQKGNLCAQLALGFCLLQSGLMAGEPAEITLLSVSDETHNRVELVIPEDGYPGEVIVRHYEDNVLLLEWTLQGRVRLGGQAFLPTRLVTLGEIRQHAEHGKSIIVIGGILYIVDEAGSTIPPSGGGSGTGSGTSGGGFTAYDGGN